jgi:hypothetical protein
VTPTLPPGPPAGAVRPLAATIFGRLGLEGAEQVLVGAPATTATLTPYVATRRTSGWSTSLTFDRHDRQVRLTSASGWVGGATRGAVYPLISARRAFDELQRQPRPMIAMCPVRTDGKPGCAPIPTPAVTGVTIGLALRHDGDRPLLVPAWLFTLAGGGDPEAVVAVDPRYLATPSPGVR